MSELHEIWNRKLYTWWSHYNQEYLSGALKRPVIQLSESTVDLGQWNGDARVITISLIHIRKDPWTEVMETLRHEMAHQYAQEILVERHAPPHGDAFKTACKHLRCHPAATASGSGNGANSEDVRMLRVLKKLLSLGTSPNENEAQVAVQKARLLLVKYNIDLVELDRERQFQSRYLGAVKGRRTSAELWLASILNSYFFVEVIWAHSYDAKRDRNGSILQIFGTPQNLDMSEYVYHYLTDLLTELWTDYRLRSNLKTNRERQRYYAGVLEGFFRKLQEQGERLRETEALVWKGDAKLKEYYRFINPRIERRYGGGVRVTGAYQDGVKDGRTVSIRKPMTAASKGGGRYLKN